VRITLAAILFVLALALAGCSSPAPTSAGKQPAVEVTGPATTSNKHPLAKYIELAGFRLSESKPGQLDVKFVAVNHSEAELGDLVVNIQLQTTAAKAGDPPVAQFQATIPALSPLEIHDVSAKVSTKMRIYELPDWQFLRAEFEITSPAP
jgi:ABC-type glycerol-3-phosphate transport system substrate-binding protein